LCVILKYVKANAGVPPGIRDGGLSMKRLGYFVSMLIAILPGTFLPVKAAPYPQQATLADRIQKRLILNDGSYELIGQYSIEGKRVRYFSTERNAWEELPYSIIDWAATEKYAAWSAQEADVRRNDALDRAAAERKEEEAHLPLVMSGLRIPAPEGVFLLDVYQGTSELNKLGQSGGDLNKNMGSNILRGIINPVAGSKQTVEIKGLRARIQSHVAQPAIYFAIDPADPAVGYNSETARNHLRIVRCTNKKGNRIVATIDIAVYGKVRQQTQFIETTVERISDYWVKISPAAPLQPGEYALVEFDEKGSMNQFVWDFGADPAAPPNSATMIGDAERKEPVLIQKPQKTTGP
jgi:hypothetical protein